MQHRRSSNVSTYGSIERVVLDSVDAGDLMGDSQREKLKVLFVATLLMLSSVLLAVLLPNQGAYSEESRGVAFDHQLITYYSNNGVDQSYSVEYDGIASSEYNPEYWAGTFDDVLGTSVQNWSGPKTDGTVNGSFTIGYDISAKTTYTLTFSDRDITIISCTSNNGKVNYDNDSIFSRTTTIGVASLAT